MAVQKKNERYRRAGLAAFLLSGVCGISSSVIVSLLRDHYGLTYSLTGAMLSLFSVGNMAAGFMTGVMTRRDGMRRTVLTLSLGYFIGYGLMAFLKAPWVLMAAFLLCGIGKGNVLNTCTVLVGNNSDDRPKGMTLMHACYALGALLCPFLISAVGVISWNMPMAGVSLTGLALWLIFASCRLPAKETPPSGGTGRAGDLSFLKSPSFWILTALVFCQNAAEQSVNGWLVTYFKDQGILSGTLSAYTITIMWGATLLGRLLLAFAVRIRNIFRALSVMGAACTVLYIFLVRAQTPAAATIALFAFAFAMAGVNPLAVAGVGEQMSAVSMGILLPVGGIGAVVMPMIIGVLADGMGLRAAMAANIVPCAGMLVLSLVMYRRTK